MPMNKTNIEFMRIAKSKCLKSITNIVCDPRLNGSAICLYFELLKLINDKGLCEVNLNKTFNQCFEITNFKSLKDIGYIDFDWGDNLLNVRFNVL